MQKNIIQHIRNWSKKIYVSYETCRIPSLYGNNLVLDFDFRSFITKILLNTKKNDNNPKVLIESHIDPINNYSNKITVLHIIANIEIGGSQQLMYDIVNGLNKKYNMLIMNLATHSLFIVNNRSFINFTTKEDLLKIVKQYHCGLIHIHYYGNYSNFHSYLKFLLNSLPPHIKVIENVNNPIKPYIHKNVSQYIFVSNYSFKVQKLKLKNASVIYPGVDTKLFFPQTYLNNQIFDIGLVYRLNNDKLSKKTIDLLIKIVKLSKKPTVFHIVGDGPNFNYYLEQVKARKVRNNFRFYGFVDYHQLPNIYNNFDLFLAPVHTESYGVVVPYALAKNIPVVGMDVGALPEILNCRKYLAKDEENLVKMVLKYSNVKYLKNYDINFLNKRITTFFSKQKMLKQYKAVYKLGLN